MIHDSERKSANFKRSAERSRRSHDAIIKLRKKIANEDMRERINPRRTHCSYHSTPPQMKPGLPILTGEYQASSAHQHSLQELAERAAIILALKVASSKQPNQS